MKTILITGASGFIGTNLVERLSMNPEYKILQTSSKTNDETLKQYVLDADFIVHLAGLSRTTDPAQFGVVNTDMTKLITDTLIENSKNTPVIFTSSIHAALENEYGQSKRDAETEMQKYEKLSHSTVYIFRLTNTFGPHARVNAHSAVANFCYNISHNLEVNISNPNNELNLLYIDDLLDVFCDLIENKENKNLIKDGKFYMVSKTFKLNLGELVQTINLCKDMQNQNETDDEFTKYMFRTYSFYKKI